MLSHKEILFSLPQDRVKEFQNQEGIEVVATYSHVSSDVSLQEDCW